MEDKAMSSNPRGSSRYPRNMEGLLRLAIENTSSASTVSSEDSRPTILDPERRRLLEEAIATASVNVIDVLRKNVKILIDAYDSEENVADKEAALDEILAWVDNIDFANDFHRIGGFSVLKPGLQSSYAGIRYRTAEVIAELVQNNPYCQKAATDCGLVRDLTQLLDIDPEDIVRIKSLYALSGLLRDNPTAQCQFLDLDGSSVLLRAMQSNVDKLKIKSSIMLSMLCRQQPSNKDTLCDMGFVDQLVVLIQQDHDATHEHIFSALYYLISDNQKGILECQKPELNLRDTLLHRMDLLKGNDQYLEELEYCEKIMKLCFNYNDNHQEDR